VSKTIYLLLLLLSLVSCGKKQNSEDCSGPECSPLNGPLLPSSKSLVIDNLTGVPQEALTFETKLELVNFEYDEMEKVLTAADLIREVVATKEFRSEVINHTVNGVRTFIDNDGLSNEQIYQIILEGAERLRPERNNTLDVSLKLYYENTNVIGYTYTSSHYIWLMVTQNRLHALLRVHGNKKILCSLCHRLHHGSTGKKSYALTVRKK
jgi:hypothetical protein